MVERLNARQYLWVLVVIVALFVSTVGVTALAQTDEGDVFTGCLNDNSGVLGKVAVGLDPAKPCNPQESQITWDRAGPAFEERIAALEEQVASHTVGAPSPVELFAAATVDVTTIEASVGPIESVTQVGAAHYRIAFGEDVFGDIAPRSTAFISLATNSAYGTYCTYQVWAPDELDIYCWNGAEGGNQPEDAEWSLTVFEATDPPSG